MNRLIVLCVSLAVAACGSTGIGSAINIPGSSQPLTIASASERYVYDDVELDMTDTQLRLLFPRTERCASILVAGQSVSYVSSGPLGVVESEGQRCNAIGVADIRSWLDFRNRAQIRAPRRSQTNFNIVSEDSELIFLRGRFRSATLLGFGFGGDMVALVPNHGDCPEIAKTGIATLQFDNLRDEPYSLLAGKRTCTVTGFALPVPSAEKSASEG